MKTRATAFVRALDPRVAAVAITFLLFAVALFSTCGGCGHHSDATSPSAGADAGGVAPISSSSLPVDEGDASMLRDPLLWGNAKSGEAEDLATLAVNEGAMGLVEAAATTPSLRPTAIRAMGYAHGYAQLPFLAKAASGKDEEEAMLALDATLELAARVRRAEDPEDTDELREGCEGLDKLARDVTRPRPRRIASIRALRMMPCPPPAQDLPADLDAK